jgi:phenylpropionate dioxygenase-like ring-hydroxylating dioxygenase large terminal subunit
MSIKGTTADGFDLRRTGINPNFWYPLARSRDVKPGKIRGLSFAGEAIALARTQSGVVFALEDRCAHRQIPLHMGVLSGDTLRCAYHGWCYDLNGKITRVPYLPKGAVPQCRSVRSFPCREAYGHIFIFPGEPAKANKVPLPEVAEWNSPDYLTMRFKRRVNCHYTFMHENLMDMNHQFLHRKLMGNVQPVMLDWRKGENWIEASYKFRQDGTRPHRGSSFMMAGADRSGQPVERNFELMVVRTEYPYQILKVYPAHSDATAVTLWATYVPIDREQRVNHSFGILMVRKPWIPGLAFLLWPAMRYFTELVFRQDKMIVEAEQRAYDAQGADLNQEVFPLIVSLREILRKCGIAPQAASEPVSTPLSLSARLSYER